MAVGVVRIFRLGLAGPLKLENSWETFVHSFVCRWLACIITAPISSTQTEQTYVYHIMQSWSRSVWNPDFPVNCVWRVKAVINICEHHAWGIFGSMQECAYLLETHPDLNPNIKTMRLLTHHLKMSAGMVVKSGGVIIGGFLSVSKVFDRILLCFTVVLKFSWAQLLIFRI